MSKLSAVAQFESTLSSGISSSATTAILSSNITGDQDDAILPAGTYGFVIDESNSYREYLIATVSGTSLTITKRGLSFIDGDTEKTTNKFAHRKGASIKIVSFPVITRMLAQLNGDLSLDGVPKLPATRTISDPRHATDKEYVDSILASGIASLAVSDNGGITININSGYFSLNGDLTFYAGASNQSLTNNATNYVELVDGALSINTTAFSDDAMPLARVITLSNDITSLLDARAILGWLDIKASSGIGRDSSGLFIDLATNPGLEFSSGKLRIKAYTGLVLGANGLAVNVGVNNGEIVQMTTGNKLPAVDASLLTNINASRKIVFDYTAHTFNNSDVENIYFTTTVAGGSLGTGNYIRGRIVFSLINDNGSSTDTVFKLYYGTTVIATLTISFANSGITCGIIDFIVSATGATNTQQGIIVGSFQDGSCKIVQTSGTATEDSTANKTLKLTMTLPDSGADGTSIFGYAELIK